MRGLFLFALVMLISVAVSDVYLQGCVKGSNNRISARNNGNNRLFDSQNNDNGGYGLHPKMRYYQESDLQLQWTNQHGCGNPNVNCNMVLQYMCADSPAEIRNGRKDTDLDVNTANATRHALVMDLDDTKDCEDGDNGDCGSNNDGEDTWLHSQTGDYIDEDEVIDTNLVYKYGQHENFEYYNECQTRNRNGGLFTADENIADEADATHTRQNPNGNGNNNNEGLECPEERDYYPYWHESPWVDIAVITDDVDRCDYYKAESQNVKAVNRCSNPKYNNKVECESVSLGNGVWETVPAKGLPAPECLEAAYTRDNHLGNAEIADIDGVVNPHYTWKLPKIAKGFCVVRIRYNISSADYDGWATDSNQNDGQSPVTDDPVVFIGDKADNVTVRLNVDVEQFGRTFQDRSHVFAIRERPSFLEGITVHNVNIRGERGNIVQTYPSTEYDFCPTEVKVAKGEYVHFQFAGTDTNKNNQAGNGRDRTDRSNIVEISLKGANYPISYDSVSEDDSFFSSEEAIIHGFLNQTGCNYAVDPDDDNDEDNCYVLNRAPRYFESLHKVRSDDKAYYFSSTRNNDFTNRSHKLKVDVDEKFNTSDPPSSGSPASSLTGLVAFVF